MLFTFMFDFSSVLGTVSLNLGLTKLSTQIIFHFAISSNYATIIHLRPSYCPTYLLKPVNTRDAVSAFLLILPVR